MTRESTLQDERLCFAWLLARFWHHRLEILDFPNLGRMVSGAGRKMLDIRGEQDSSDVVIMSLEVGDGHELGLLAVLHEVPDINAALVFISFTLPSKLGRSYRVGTGTQS